MNQGEADALATRRRLKDDFLDVNKSVQTYLRSLKGYRRSERKILGQDTSPNNPMPVRQRALDALLKLDENKPPSNVVHEVHNLPTTEPEYRPRSRKFRRRR